MLKRVPKLPAWCTEQGEPISTSSCASVMACDIQESSRLLTGQNPQGPISLSLTSDVLSGATKLTRMPWMFAFNLSTFIISQTNMVLMMVSCEGRWFLAKLMSEAHRAWRLSFSITLNLASVVKLRVSSPTRFRRGCFTDV